MDWGWIGRNLDLIGGRVLEHVALTAPPIVIGLVLSIPLGYWASRSRVARSILLVLGNIVYTIPAIALLVLVPVLLGGAILDPVNLVIALTLYALALMVRSAADAFAAVPHDVVSSATSIGYSAWQRFFAVELPLAGPVLLAGIRVVSVSTVSLASVGALTGIENLGSFFIDAFQRQFLTEALVGIVAVLVVAAVFDVVLQLLGRLLMPWNRRNRRAAENPALLRTPPIGGVA
ncbi:ABC transporter permease subunit [Pseudolysinimonas kribbensis]|jgi:osmoprotectant transport system permease protein|uniref:Glycine/betaine ABC transporter permease n=1 Tax=Pseudolysinimonas kribbensis TaxID=433641 RepID=A0ABQ6K822_9MICO|nr:ABC transporter permease subunit [Pseudolysinimonas kribbensis]GMA96554.1 glycine/betaine ABC transporter permease [Pseudolysinimonas kribbensis]